MTTVAWSANRPDEFNREKVMALDPMEMLHDANKNCETELFVV